MRILELFEGTSTIQIGTKTVNTTISQNGYTEVLTDVAKFDNAWSGSELYIGPGGTGSIKDRYKRFGTFINGGVETLAPGIEVPVEPATSIELPDVNVTGDGNVVFVNGRHRYAWLRDNGVDTIPVAMDTESIKHAKRHGLIQ